MISKNVREKNNKKEQCCNKVNAALRSLARSPRPSEAAIDTDLYDVSYPKSLVLVASQNWNQTAPTLASIPFTARLDCRFQIVWMASKVGPIVFSSSWAM